RYAREVPQLQAAGLDTRKLLPGDDDRRHHRTGRSHERSWTRRRRGHRLPRTVSGRARIQQGKTGRPQRAAGEARSEDQDRTAGRCLYAGEATEPGDGLLRPGEIRPAHHRRSAGRGSGRESTLEDRPPRRIPGHVGRPTQTAARPVRLDRRDRCRRSPTGHLRVARCQRRQYEPFLLRFHRGRIADTEHELAQRPVDPARGQPHRRRTHRQQREPADRPRRSRRRAGGHRYELGRTGPVLPHQRAESPHRRVRHHPRRGDEGRAVPQTRAFRSRRSCPGGRGVRSPCARFLRAAQRPLRRRPAGGAHGGRRPDGRQRTHAADQRPHARTRCRRHSWAAVIQRLTDRTTAGRPERGGTLAHDIDRLSYDDCGDVDTEEQRADDHDPRTAADRALFADYRAAGLSREALDRLVALARALRTVRSGTGTISSIIRTAMAETGIDSDIWGLNDSLRNLHRSAVDSCLSAASQYATTDDQPTITGFLSWLSLMEAHDALNAVEPTAAADAINIMTVHASKGLEFDAVAVPSLVVKDFPTEPRDKE